MESEDRYGEINRAIEKFKELSIKCRYGSNIEEFISQDLINEGLRPHLRVLYSAFERMSFYSLDDFERMKEMGASFRKQPRYDFSCHEQTAQEMFYTFATGKNKFTCDISECIENLADFLSNYKAVLKFEEKKG